MTLPLNARIVGKCPKCGGLKVIGTPPAESLALPIAECRSCCYVAPKDLRKALAIKAQREATV